MTDTDRMIWRVYNECAEDVQDPDGCMGMLGVHASAAVPLTTATVNTALLGVCPECLGHERGDVSPMGQWHPKQPCPNPYHDHRERMEAATNGTD